MPDFRRRVHSGQTFVVAGDRFAIGSSREMSPAGLKGVAEEVGRELVIICGQNMGDIFRRNAFNLGLHVAQCPEAVADAEDDDEFTFDPQSREIVNVTRGRTYTPVPLSTKEEEIRRSGGIFEVGRREFRTSIVTRPVVDFPDESLASAMTSTEQIVWAHRVDKDLTRKDLRPGATLRVYADLLPASDGTAPFAIHTFNQITGGETIFPRQAAIANDHFVFTGKDEDEKQTSIGRAFAGIHGLGKPYYATPGDGIFHFYFPGAGSGPARPVHSRRRFAQPRLRRLWRRRHRRRVDHARVRLVDRLHLLHAGPAAARRLHGPVGAVGRRQGHRPRTAAPLGREAVAGHVGRVRRCRPRTADGGAQHDRQHDGGGRGVERDLRARRADAATGIARKGTRRLPYPLGAAWA